MRDGLYFLANDDVYDLTVAFLNSVRRAHDLPLCLIPFDRRIGRLGGLAGEYRFSIFDRRDVLERCDALSRSFHAAPVGHYRKLAAWEGPFERFIYIDVDTIVLHDLTIVFRQLDDYDFVFARSGHNGRQWVWKDSVLADSCLSASQVDFAANTGFICSRACALTVDDAQGRLEAASRLRPHMELLCFEQPFINYLVVTSGRRYTSLAELAAVRGDTMLPLELWAGVPGGQVEHGTVRMPGANPVLFVHWAGRWREKTERVTPPGDPPRPGEMPYEGLWRHYRELRSAVTGFHTGALGSRQAGTLGRGSLRSGRSPHRPG